MESATFFVSMKCGCWDFEGMEGNEGSVILREKR